MGRRTPEQKAKHAAAMRRWRANATPEQLEATREATRRWKANLTPEQRHAKRSKTAEKRRRCRAVTYEQLLALEESQGNQCAMCGKTAADNGKALSIDHDHTTGHVRGLLCDTCNRGIGLLKDSPDLLQSAIAYLTSPPARDILKV